MNEFEQLKKEFIAEGASYEEAENLVDLKYKIGGVSDFKRSDKFKRTFLSKLYEKDANVRIFPRARFFTPAFMTGLVLVLVILITAGAQAALPGQPLYPVKILSENILKTVNPSFKDEILRRRSEEVKTITEQKKDSSQLNKTINKYENDLENNKNVNPTKIQESKKNLEDASENSHNGEKDQIDHAIGKTEDKIKQFEKENVEKNVKGVTESRDHGADPEQNSNGKSGEDHGQSQESHEKNK